jgi:hypothetical protein
MQTSEAQQVGDIRERLAVLETSVEMMIQDIEVLSERQSWAISWMEYWLRAEDDKRLAAAAPTTTPAPAPSPSPHLLERLQTMPAKDLLKLAGAAGLFWAVASGKVTLDTLAKVIPF